MKFHTVEPILKARERTKKGLFFGVYLYNKWSNFLLFRDSRIFLKSPERAEREAHFLTYFEARGKT